jgi:hypothetical protein
MAAAWLQEGHFGTPLWAHIVWFEHRPPIGKCAPSTPTDLDYDLWCGPAPLESLTRPQLHYDWHWFWSTGDGDLGNSGIHAFDACRMFAQALTAGQLRALRPNQPSDIEPPFALNSGRGSCGPPALHEETSGFQTFRKPMPSKSFTLTVANSVTPCTVRVRAERAS